MESNHSNCKKLVSKSSYLKNPTRMHFYQCRTAAISKHLVKLISMKLTWISHGTHVNPSGINIEGVVLTHSKQREARVYSIPKLSSNEWCKNSPFKDVFLSGPRIVFELCI